MKISLKKCSRFITELETQVIPMMTKQLQASTCVNISVLTEDVEKSIKDAIETTNINVSNLMFANELMLQLRWMVGKENTHKINELVVQRMAIKNKISVLESMTRLLTVNARTSHDAEALQKLIAYGKQTLAVTPSKELADSSYSLNTVKAFDLAVNLSSFRRELRDLEDELATENISRTVTLEPELVTALQQLGVLDTPVAA